jgi:cysteine synthase
MLEVLEFLLKIWKQTGGRIHGWTVATGTGGTFAGVSTYLKQQDPTIKCVVADPPGSVLFNYITYKPISPLLCRIGKANSPERATALSLRALGKAE